MTKRDAYVAAGYATLIGVLWAFTLGAAAALPAGIPTVEMVAGRYLLQAILLGACLLPFRGISVVRSSRPRLQLLRGLMMLIMPVTFELAVQRIGAADAFALLWLAPLFGIVATRLLLGESSSLTTIVIAAVATAGGLLAHTPTAFTSVSGLLAELCAAASFGAFFALTRAVRQDSTATGLIWTALCVAVPASIVSIIHWHPLGLRAMVVIAAIGVLWLGVLYAIDETLRRAPLAVVTPLLLGEVLWLRLLVHAPWTRGAVVGTALVVGCAVIAIMRLLSASGENAAVLDPVAT
jgi:drug/metabolite transporter (DMT)-like permease